MLDLGKPARVFGVDIDPVTEEQLVHLPEAVILAGERRTVLYANVHVLNQAWADGGLREILRAADVVYCDGAGVAFAARLLGQWLPGRTTGADWIHPFAAASAAGGFSLYLLGSAPGIAEQAAGKLTSRYPGLTVVGSHHGYVQTPNEASAVVAEINSAEPDILLVGMGTPVQERWIAAHRADIGAPVCWAVGALFDYVAGVLPRGPRWMVDHSLEWVFRLAVEPRRLAGRYLIGNPKFLLRVLAQRAGYKRSQLD
jgi:N-acetylglucosaminyldiphosphoundecaprenol N-acetyl-beta-D-mannosaminyltransferase